MLLALLMGFAATDPVLRIMLNSARVKNYDPANGLITRTRNDPLMTRISRILKDYREAGALHALVAMPPSTTGSFLRRAAIWLGRQGVEYRPRPRGERSHHPALRVCDPALREDFHLPVLRQTRQRASLFRRYGRPVDEAVTSRIHFRARCTPSDVFRRRP
jgi:hypothetical protein